MWMLLIWLASGTCVAKANVPDDSFNDLARVVRAVLLETMPMHLEDTRQWGKQRPFIAGLELRRDGMRLETKRKWELRNHGDWRRFSGTMVNPEESFAVKVRNIQSESAGQFVFDLEFSALVAWEVRQAQWERGVQLWSISAMGTASVQMAVEFELTTSIERNDTGLVVSLNPTVRKAHLAVDEFRVRRISKLGGEVAKRVTTIAQRYLDDELNRLNDQLADRINRKIADRRDRLRISLDEWSRAPNWGFGGRLNEAGWQNEESPDR